MVTPLLTRPLLCMVTENGLLVVPTFMLPKFTALGLTLTLDEPCQAYREVCPCAAVPNANRAASRIPPGIVCVQLR